MKKTILALAVTALLTGSLFTSCNSSTEKVADAQKNVIEANKDLDKATNEYLEEIETYRKEKSEKIGANIKSIAEFNERISKEKKAAREEYKKKIDALEQKNSDMKKKMDEYKAEGKEKWEAFKTDFNKNMDEIGQALRDLIDPLKQVK